MSVDRAVTATGTRWAIAMDGFVPPSVNRLLALHWARAQKVKQSVYAHVAVARHLAGAIPDATCTRRVSVAVTVSGRSGLPDPDNILKCLVDALVHNRLLVDDAAAWCRIGDVSVARGPATRTVVTLEDVR